jgi:hypothetical protein
VDAKEDSMACNFEQLQQAVARNLQALAELRSENCSEADDPGECFKLRAESMATVRGAIDSLQYQIRICGLLVGTWGIRAANMQNMPLDKVSGKLWIKSWDAATHRLDETLLLGDGRNIDFPAGFSAATFDPGDLWIDVMAYFLSDAGNPELAVSYSGNVIANTQPLTASGEWADRFGASGGWSATKLAATVFWNPAAFTHA